ncbi:MAG: YbjQ family protein [Planctomycetota bacterium]
MILVTTEAIKGYEVEETFGIVCGTTVRARHVGKDVQSVMQNFVGGEILHYTKLLAEAREQALDRMAEQARARGANAVITLRFSTSEIATGAAEVVAYGTAVRVRRTAG